MTRRPNTKRAKKMVTAPNREKSFSPFAIVSAGMPSPAVRTENEAQVVADCGGDGRHHDYPSELQLVFGVSQETRHQQCRLSRNRHTCVFQKQCDGYYPVSVMSNRISKKLDDDVSHAAGATRNRKVPTAATLLSTRTRTRITEIRLSRAFDILSSGQKFNQGLVELLRTFFVRKVADAGKQDRLYVAKMPSQGIHRRSIHCLIFAAPHQ
jgi:hypothetical protein